MAPRTASTPKRKAPARPDTKPRVAPHQEDLLADAPKPDRAKPERAKPARAKSGAGRAERAAVDPAKTGRVQAEPDYGETPPFERPDNQGLMLGYELTQKANDPRVGFMARVSPKDEGAGAAPSDTIWFGGDGHLTTIAPTGCGKGRGLIIPNLLNYPGPAIVIDPKGENYRVTARFRREMGHQIVALDPFGIVTDKPDAFNPLDIFKLPNCLMEIEAELIAEMFVGENRHPRHAFWDNLARHLISGTIVHVVHDLPPEERNLGSVFDILFQDDVPYNLAVRLDTKQVKHAYAQRAFATFLGLSDRYVRPDVLSTAQSHMNILVSDTVRQAVSKSSITLDQIIEGKPLTVYLIIPPEYLESHGRMLRLWIGAFLRAILKRTRPVENRTLFLLDEVAQLGSLSILRQAVTLFRHFGLQCWMFWQDMSQLKLLYPADWQTLLNQSHVVQAFGFQNNMMAREFADFFGGIEPLRLQHLPHDLLVQVRSGGETEIARRPDYLKDRLFADRFDPNPMYVDRPRRQK